MDVPNVGFSTAGARYILASWREGPRGLHGRGALLTACEGRSALARALTFTTPPELSLRYRSLLPDLQRARPELEAHDMREALLEAVERGELVVFETTLHGRGLGAARVVDEAPAKKPAPAPKQDTTWVGIVLFDDDEPPKPVPYVSYRIELPDGAVRTGMLDGNGRARLDGIDPGTCKVSFPSFDRRDWSPR
jgi:hypothetical protein